MRIFISILLLLSTVTGFAQPDTTTLLFLNDVIKRKSDTGTIFYAEKIDAGMYDHMMKKLVIKKTIKDIGNATKDRLKLTSTEISFIDQNLIAAKEKVWEDALFQNSKRIPIDSLQSFLFQDPQHDIYIFSQPVFIRNNTIALFYLIHLCCGGIKGPVDLSFYKRNGKKWERWIRIDGGAF